MYQVRKFTACVAHFLRVSHSGADYNYWRGRVGQPAIRAAIPSPAPGPSKMKPPVSTHAEMFRAIEEELANGLTHGLGLVLSVAGMVGLVVLTALHGTIWHVVGCTVYGTSLVLLYLVSTLYHSVRDPGWKRVLRRVDHMAIFLLIAGTYTPFTLVNLRGPTGWTLFALVWGLAVAGIAFKLRWGHRLEWVSLALYLSMGWLCVIAAKQIVATIPTGGLLWLLGGGLCYTFGTIFYALDHRWRYFHAVWHVFVLAGSGLHYVAVLLYVVPLAA